MKEIEHWNKGNKHAGKENKNDSFVHIRCRKEDKARWLRASNAKKQKFAAWVRDALNRHSEG